MADGKVHFEIYLKANRKAGWVLSEATENRDAAMTRANALLKANPAGSVRVAKETFDPRTRTFQAVTVFEQGGEKFEDNGRADRKAELPCNGPADLAGRHARDLIARALSPWLRRNTVTPLELLHRTDLVERLEASGTEMQHAVQKIAIAQAQSADASAQHFVKQINALIQSAVEILFAESRKGETVALKPGALKGHAAQWSSAADRQRRLRAAIARRLKDSRSWKVKLERLLELAEEAHDLAPDMTWPLEVIAEFMAETVAVDEARSALLGKVEDLGGELDGLTELFCARSDAAACLSGAGARLAWFFGADHFDETRVIIARRILDALKSPRRLRPTNFAEEVLLNRSIADRLIRTASPLIAAEEVGEAFVTRSARLLDPEAIETYLATAADPGAGVLALAQLEENIVGESNKRNLAAYLTARLGAHTTENHFVYADTPILRRLGELSTLRKRVDASSFEDQDQERIGEKIDALAIAAEGRAKLIDKIAGRAMNPLEKAAALLRLAAKGGVPEGALAERVRATAMKVLSDPETRALAARGGDATEELLREISNLARPRAAAKAA